MTAEERKEAIAIYRGLSEQVLDEERYELLAEWRRSAVQAEREALEPHLATIIRKCEQYWNEPNICDAEVHSILEFIHGEVRAIRNRKL